MNNKLIETATHSAWQEEVYIETAEFIIKGTVFMPKIGKKTRFFSDMLNTNKTFIAVKFCTIEYKLQPNRNIEHHDFIQVNISTILIMRPLNE